MDNIENVSFEPAPGDKFPRSPHCKEELQTIWLKNQGHRMGWTEGNLDVPSL